MISFCVAGTSLQLTATLFSVFLVYDKPISLPDGSNDKYLYHDLTQKAYSGAHVKLVAVRATVMHLGVSGKPCAILHVVVACSQAR